MTSEGHPLRAAYTIRGLDKSFGATHAVDNVSMSFTAGRVHCLLGENGAGKSTIGKMLGGYYAPDKGTIFVGDTPIAAGDMTAARAAGVALVFQELSLAPDLSVRDNICLGMQPRHPIGWRRGRAEDKLCRRVLDDLGLQLPLDAIVGALPQAHQQLVEVAKALASQPKLLILDEPTAMLGGDDRDRLFATIRRLRGTGVAFVLVTHHIEEVLAIGDDISILQDGRLVATLSVTPDLTVAEVSRRLIGRQNPAAAGTPAAERDTGEPLLTIEGVLGRSEAPQAIEVAMGQIVAIYGVVGCGREEIARAVVGLAKPSAGVRLRLSGRAYAPSSPSRAARHRVAYLPSGRAANCVLPTLSIRENLMLRQLRGRFGLLQWGPRERKRAKDELRRYGTRLRHQDDSILSLSGGNQQKVMLGRSIGAGGDLLVLEDPTAGVDIGAKGEIHAILKREVEKGLGVLLVSSDLNETIELADSVYTMFSGKVVSRYRAPLAGHRAAIVSDIVGGTYGDPTKASQEVLHVDA